MRNLRDEIAKTIGVTTPDDPAPCIEYRLLESTKEDGYTRQLIEYDSCGDKVSAFLLLPEVLEKNPAVLIHHQHNREHHLGKSEVCGLAGNSLQAFGPELAKRGFVVLAPDAICFEERRENPLVEGFDFWQHFNEMCYRIIKGDSLMKKMLSDAINGITLLAGLDFVDNKRIMIYMIWYPVLRRDGCLLFLRKMINIQKMLPISLKKPALPIQNLMLYKICSIRDIPVAMR